jgi:phenylalanine-4-hydroxylase
MVYGINSRYQRVFVGASANPWRAYKQAALHAEAFYRSEQYLVPLSSPGIRDLLQRDHLQRALHGVDPMIPTWENQQLWAAQLSPSLAPRLAVAREDQVWSLLCSFNQPLLEASVDQYHFAGIEELAFSFTQTPTVATISPLLKRATGWQVVAASEEINPARFFALLAERIFPVVESLRPLHALLCGYEPDLWHEVVGHLALLYNPHYASWYQELGTLAAELARNLPDDEAIKLYQVLWVLIEYGIIRLPDGSLQVFGGALSSSYMGLQRLQRAIITTRLFDPRAVINSGVAEEAPIKPRRGKIQLFHINSHAEVLASIVRWGAEKIKRHPNRRR